MKVKDLRLGLRDAKLEGTITKKGSVRETRNDLRVCNATFQDDTGKIPLSLWLL